MINNIMYGLNILDVTPVSRKLRGPYVNIMSLPKTKCLISAMFTARLADKSKPTSNIT